MPRKVPSLPFIGLEHLEAHSMRLLGSASAAGMKSSVTRFSPGNVLYGRLRPYLNKVYRPTIEGVCSPEFIVFPDSEAIDNSWLQYRLNCGDFVGFASKQKEGDRPRIDFDHIESFPLLLPPLDEQRRIVAAIEERLTHFDAAVAGLKRLQANLKRYRAAVLTAAVEGRLLPSPLLNGPLPRGWQAATLGQHLAGIEAGKSFKCEERPPVGSEVGVVKVSAVTWGTFYPEESKTVTEASRIEERFFIRERDFLFSRANTIELVGACLIVDRVDRTLMLSDKILRFRVKDIDPRWLLLCLRSRHGRREIERLSTGNQESMRNIGQDRIRQVKIAVPPAAEQKEIVAEVDRRFSIIDELAVTVDTALVRAARLRQAILKRAFEGNLVPQNPNDEPASVLLERIRRTREATPTRPRRTPRRRVG